MRIIRCKLINRKSRTPGSAGEEDSVWVSQSARRTGHSYGSHSFTVKLRGSPGEISPWNHPLVSGEPRRSADHVKRESKSNVTSYEVPTGSAKVLSLFSSSILHTWKSPAKEQIIIPQLDWGDGQGRGQGEGRVGYSRCMPPWAEEARGVPLSCSMAAVELSTS